MPYFEITGVNGTPHKHHVLWVAAASRAQLDEYLAGCPFTSVSALEEGPDTAKALDYTLPQDAIELREKLHEFANPALSMKVKLLIGATAAYACITTPTTSLDVKLNAGHSAWYSLRESAVDDRIKARRLIERAALMDQAADILEREKLESGLRDAHLEQGYRAGHPLFAFDAWLTHTAETNGATDAVKRLLALRG